MWNLKLLSNEKTVAFSLAQEFFQAQAEKLKSENRAVLKMKRRRNQFQTRIMWNYYKELKIHKCRKERNFLLMMMSVLIFQPCKVACFIWLFLLALINHNNDQCRTLLTFISHLRATSWWRWNNIQLTRRTCWWWWFYYTIAWLIVMSVMNFDWVMMTI